MIVYKLTEPMIVYKLTDEYGMTRNDTQWGKGISHETDGHGDLCGPGWLHFYTSRELAEFLNPLHGKFDFLTMILWEAEATGKFKDDCGLKGGCTRLTTLRRLERPIVTDEHRVEFAIRCANKFDQPRAWLDWAEKWMSGEDRSATAAVRARSEEASWSPAAWSTEAAVRLAAGRSEEVAVLSAVAARLAAQAYSELDVELAQIARDTLAGVPFVI